MKIQRVGLGPKRNIEILLKAYIGATEKGYSLKKSAAVAQDVFQKLAERTKQDRVEYARQDEFYRSKALVKAVLVGTYQAGHSLKLLKKLDYNNPECKNSIHAF